MSSHDSSADYSAIADRVYIESWALALVFGAVDQGLAHAWPAAIACGIMSAICQFVVIRWAAWIKGHPENRLLRSLNAVATNAGWWIATLMVFVAYLALSNVGQTWWQRKPGPSADEIAAAVIHALPNGAIRAGATSKPIPDHLIKNPAIELDDKDRIYLRGAYAKAGNDVVAYVTYRMVHSALGLAIGPSSSIIDSPNAAIEPRIKIDTVSRFDRDEIAKIMIGTVFLANGNQQTIKWGRPELNNIGIGITWGSYIGLLILVGSDRSEDAYPFMIVARSTQGNPLPAIIFGPQMFSSFSELTPNAK